MATKKSNKVPEKVKPSDIVLTQRFIDSKKEIEKCGGWKIPDKTIAGLNLYVGKSGSKSWYIRYRDRDNKSQAYRFGSDKQYNLVAARKEAKQILGRIAKGENPAAKKRDDKQAALDKEQATEVARSRTLRKFLEGYYWTHYLSSQKSGLATKKRILSAFEPFLDTHIAEITSEDLVEHRTGRLKSAAPQTLNRDRLAIHALFEVAVSIKEPARLISINPANKKDYPPLKTVNDERVRYLGQHDEHENFSKGERQRFMDALKTMPLNIQTLVGLALNTGCRRGELFSLKWENVSIKNKRITLDARTTKTDKKRFIPLNKKAIALLDTWHTKKGEKVTHISGLVFPSQITGKRMTDIKRSWKTLVSRAEVTDFRFHDLRHDFASRLVMKGVPLIKVRDLLGHSSIEMTERYAHLNAEELHSAVEVL